MFPIVLRNMNMKKVLLLLLFVSFSMVSYSYDWHQIAEDIYAYQLKTTDFIKEGIPLPWAELLTGVSRVADYREQLCPRERPS